MSGQCVATKDTEDLIIASGLLVASRWLLCDSKLMPGMSPVEYLSGRSSKLQGVKTPNKSANRKNDIGHVS